MSSKTGTWVEIPNYVSKQTQTWLPIEAIVLVLTGFEIRVDPYCFFSFSRFMAQALIIISLHEMTQTNVESKTGQFKRRVNPSARFDTKNSVNKQKQTTQGQKSVYMHCICAVFWYLNYKTRTVTKQPINNYSENAYRRLVTQAFRASWNNFQVAHDRQQSTVKPFITPYWNPSNFKHVQTLRTSHMKSM